MWNEHFGIGVVEMMAAGCLVVAHNSGGPKSDIIDRPARFDKSTVNDNDRIQVTTETTGFLATTNSEFSQAIYKALTLDSDTAVCIRSNARRSAERFSDEVFHQSFSQVLAEFRVLSG